MPGGVRHPYGGYGKPYREMTREEKLSFYDSHNGDTRFSNNLNERLYGVCGCGHCAETRKMWATDLAPINNPRRKGSHSMSSINVCDRDGALVTGVALGQITVRVSGESGSEVVHREVCPHCIELVLQLLEGEAQTAQRKPYTKPWRRPKVKDPDTIDNARDLVKMIVEEVNSAKAIEAPKATKVDPKDDVV